MARTAAYRRAQRARVIANRQRLIVGANGADDPFASLPPGRWAKRHPFDCTRPRCGICHPNKRWNVDRVRAKREAAREIAEQLG